MRVLVRISTPARLDILDIQIEFVPRQAVFRDGNRQRAAGYRQGLENRHPIALLGQAVAGHQAGRPGADNGHGRPIGLMPARATDRGPP